MAAGLQVVSSLQIRWTTLTSCPMARPQNLVRAAVLSGRRALFRSCFGRGVQPVVSMGRRSLSEVRNSAFGVRPLPLFVSPDSCWKVQLRMYKEGQ